MRIAVLSEFKLLNTSYRAFPITELTDRGHAVMIADGLLDRATLDGLFRYDVVYVQRAHTVPTYAFVRKLVAAGVAVVWDNDDNLAFAPRTSQFAVRQGALRFQRMTNEIARMVQVVDLVTTTSELLKEMYERMGAGKVEIVENYLPALYDPPPPVRTGDEITIGWVAALEHVHDVEQLGVADMLGRLLSRHPQLRVATVGVDLRLPLDRYRHTQHVHYQELGGQIAQYDIGIAPLDDIPFNRARSDVKLKEYAFARVPWLASPIGPYAELGEKQGGRLVADGEWEQALERLVRSPRDRRRLAKRGRRWAEGKTAARNLDAWEGALVQATERARRRRELPATRA